MNAAPTTSTAQQQQPGGGAADPAKQMCAYVGLNGTEDDLACSASAYVTF
jgi:hypothetical protein